MVSLIIRVFAATLGIFFLAWFGYIVYLGLRNFFAMRSDKNTAVKSDKNGGK